MAAARKTYHHGELRAALVQAGLDMSRTGGEQAIVLREATRRAGVTPRAAYRHFADRDALVRGVAQAALAEMARTIERRQADASDGRAMLRGVGNGYIEFALDQPGWFDVAFFAMSDMQNTAAVESAGEVGRSPYQQLADALAHLVVDGMLEPARVEEATLVCWSGVHGFATLTARGPLRQLPRPVIDAHAAELVGILVDAVSQRTAIS
jgi:AcrR family transcriptional regulator